MESAFAYQGPAREFICSQAGNVLVSAPTGAGKTRVAEYALEQHAKGCYVAPTVALCYELRTTLSQRFPGKKIVLGNKDYGLSVKEFMDADIRIVTPYRLLMLLKTVKDFSKHSPTVIFDEFHKMDAWMELAVVILRRFFWDVRIVSLSATINAEDIELLQKWLAATVFQSAERPVPLHRRIVVLPGFFDSESKTDILDPEGNCLESISEVSLDCFDGALMILRKIRKTDQAPVLFQFDARRDAESICERLFAQTRNFGRIVNHEIVSRMSTVPFANTAQDRLLKKVLPYGIGFHHAGLSREAKELVQDLAGKGLLREIATCYTLMHGVNLPARHVIIPQPYVGHPLTASSFQQISGRAGRPQFDNEGFVWIFADRENLSEVQSLIQAEPERMHSNFEDERFLVRYVPQIVGYISRRDESSGTCSRKQLAGVLMSSFARLSQTERALASILRPALAKLEKRGAIRFFTRQLFELTSAGQILARFGLHPDELDAVERLVDTGNLDYQSWVESLAAVVEDGNFAFDRQVLSEVKFYGLMVFQLTKGNRLASELAENVRRLMELSEMYMEWTGVDSEYRDAWHREVFLHFVYGDSKLLAALQSVLSRSQIKRLVRGLNTDMLGKTPAQLTPVESEVVLKNLAPDQLQPEKLAAIKKALGFEVEEAADAK